MPFPPHIEAVLDHYGMQAETKAALFDLYVVLGKPLLEVLADWAESGRVETLTPEEVGEFRLRAAIAFVERNHQRWMSGMATESFWRPRSLEGAMAGALLPLGRIGNGEAEGSVERIETAVRTMLDASQPVPEGMLLHGRNAHYSGRLDTISFDVVVGGLDDAIALARGEGRQHTVPGSIGATTGTIDEARSLALVWEVQPHVYKPVGDRNRELAPIWRRHRNWHLTTLTAMLLWLQERSVEAYVIRGGALAAAHEVDRARPLAPVVAEHHDRTVATVAEGIGAELVAPDRLALEGSEVMNDALQKFVEAEGVDAAIHRIDYRSNRIGKAGLMLSVRS